MNRHDLLGILAIIALAVGCGSRSGKSDAPAEPIPECLSYERAFNRCMGRDAGIASQTAALARTDSERAEMKSLCAINLQRIKEACP
jgi:hypothetical protein